MDQESPWSMNSKLTLVTEMLAGLLSSGVSSLQENNWTVCWKLNIKEAQSCFSCEAESLSNTVQLSSALNVMFPDGHHKEGKK